MREIKVAGGKFYSKMVRRRVLKTLVFGRQAIWMRSINAPDVKPGAINSEGLSEKQYLKNNYFVIKMFVL